MRAPVVPRLLVPRLLVPRLLVIALLGALLAGCTADTPGTDAAPSTSPADVDTVLDPCPEQPDEPATGGTTLPALSLECLGGGELDLARAPGVPTVVNLWASWCTPCRDELPVLEDFAQAAAGKVKVIGVISKDGVPQAGSFAADAGVTFPGAFDGDGRLMAELGLPGLPATYFLDADGAVVYSETGPVASVGELEDLVAEHLGVRL
jgi:cytochrome c biogenesis protein CcmG, thiol:disulfide interchange protein DsbE